MSDLARKLADYIRSSLNGVSNVEISSLRRMPEGWSRVSYMLDATWRTVDGDKETHSLVLRVDPPGSLVYSDRAVEFAVIDELHRLKYPVPKMWFLETSGEVLGAPFLVMDKLEGTASPDVLYAPDFAEERSRLGEQFIELLARLHSIDIDRVEVPFITRPCASTAADAALTHWQDTMLEQQLEPQPFMTEAFHWLRERRPDAFRVSLLHGDYRSGNFMFEGDQVTGIVDWEMASLGDPLQDLGWVFMELWKSDGRVCGFFQADEFLEKYERNAGFTVDRDALDWWIAFSNLKLAVIGLTGTRTRVLGLSDEINYSISHLYLPPLFAEVARGMDL
jgi:aminoglycoside phosphotransferase (APT) family kinase protein